jgi:hypothetical protein
VSEVVYVCRFEASARPPPTDRHTNGLRPANTDPDTMMDVDRTSGTATDGAENDTGMSHTKPYYTVGCDSMEIFATPGWRIPPRTYSRQ